MAIWGLQGRNGTLTPLGLSQADAVGVLAIHLKPFLAAPSEISVEGFLLSKLHNEVRRYLIEQCGIIEFKENYRPLWLISEYGERLELDFYIESLRLGIEVQGIQHFQYTPYFHPTPADFDAQLRRDRNKVTLCIQENIALLEITSSADLHLLLEKCGDNKKAEQEIIAFVNTHLTEVMKYLLQSKPRIVRHAHLKIRCIERHSRRLLHTTDKAQKAKIQGNLNLALRSLMQFLQDNRKWIDIAHAAIKERGRVC